MRAERAILGNPPTVSIDWLNQHYQWGYPPVTFLELLT